MLCWIRDAFAVTDNKGGKRAKELFGPFKDFAGSIGRRVCAMHKDQQQTSDQTQIGKRTSKGVLRDDFTEFFEIGAFTSDLRSGSGSLSTRTYKLERERGKVTLKL